MKAVTPRVPRLGTVRYLTLALPVLMFLTFLVFVVNPA